MQSSSTGWLQRALFFVSSSREARQPWGYSVFGLNFVWSGPSSGERKGNLPRGHKKHPKTVVFERDVLVSNFSCQIGKQKKKEKKKGKRMRITSASQGKRRLSKEEKKCAVAVTRLGECPSISFPCSPSNLLPVIMSVKKGPIPGIISSVACSTDKPRGPRTRDQPKFCSHEPPWLAARPERYESQSNC